MCVKVSKEATNRGGLALGEATASNGVVDVSFSSSIHQLQQLKFK